MWFALVARRDRRGVQVGQARPASPCCARRRCGTRPRRGRARTGRSARTPPRPRGSSQFRSGCSGANRCRYHSPSGTRCHAGPPNTDGQLFGGSSPCSPAPATEDEPRAFRRARARPRAPPGTTGAGRRSGSGTTSTVTRIPRSCAAASSVVEVGERPEERVDVARDRPRRSRRRPSARRRTARSRSRRRRGRRGGPAARGCRSGHPSRPRSRPRSCAGRSGRKRRTPTTDAGRKRLGAREQATQPGVLRIDSAALLK